MTGKKTRSGRKVGRKKAGRPQVRKGKQDASYLSTRIALLLSETSVVIYTARVRGDYDVTFISDNVRSLCGYSPRSFTAKGGFWLGHVHPDDRPELKRQVRHALTAGHYVHEYRFRHKKGHYVWTRDEMRIAYDGAGRAVEIVGYWLDVTKCKELEEDIRRRGERIMELLDAATVGYVLLDPAFNVLHVNRYLLESFGFSLEEARRMNVLDVIDDLWESGRYDKYRDVLHTGKPCIIDDVVAPFKYGERHLKIIAFKVGENIGLVIQDVTTQKRQVEKLRESEEHLRSLYESVHAGVIFCDSKGAVVRANAIACDALDVDEDEVTGQSFVGLLGDITDGQGRAITHAEHPILQVLDRAQPVRNLVVGLGAKRSLDTRWLLLSIEPILDPLTRRLDELLVTFIDFTEQKQIEDALLESEERYRHIFEDSPVGIGISLPDGSIVAANKAMLRIIGCTRDEVRTMNLADTYPVPEERQLLLQALEREGSVKDYRVQLRRKDGKIYNAVLNISRINVGGRDCYHTMCQVVD